MAFRIFLFLALTMIAGGCDRKPPAASTSVSSVSSPPATSTELPLAEPASSPLATSESKPSDAASVQLHPGFANPAANESWNAYVDAFEAVRSLPVPQLNDPVNNPAEIANHLNELGRRLEAMQSSRAAVQENLNSPEDRKRFLSAEKSLIESGQ